MRIGKGQRCLLQSFCASILCIIYILTKAGSIPVVEANAYQWKVVRSQVKWSIINDRLSLFWLSLLKLILWPTLLSNRFVLLWRKVAVSLLCSSQAYGIKNKYLRFRRVLRRCFPKDRVVVVIEGKSTKTAMPKSKDVTNNPVNNNGKQAGTTTTTDGSDRFRLLAKED